MSEEQDYVMIFEAPKIAPPEFRLYYDDNGRVVTYTCEKIEGNYIVIDAMTFAEARPDVRVVDGKLASTVNATVIAKLVPDLSEGIVCAKEDVSLIVGDDYIGDTTKWKIKLYEF